MVLELADNNSLLMNGTEQDLFLSKVGLKHYSTKIFFDTLVAGDEIIIRVYDEDVNSASEKKYRTAEVVGLQTNPENLINWMPSSSYRVTCQQITGTNKTITWALYTS